MKCATTGFGWLLAATMSLLANAASAQGCRLTSPSVVDVVPVGYEVARLTETRQPLVIQISGDAGCDFIIGFGMEGASGRLRQLRGGSESLGYLLSASPSGDAVLRDLPAATSSETLRGTVGTLGSTQFTVWVVVPSGQRVGPGPYRDTVKVNLYSSNGERLLDSRSMALQLGVLPMLRAQLEVSGASGPFAGAARRLDFGEISHGARGEVNLVMDANVGYSLSVESRERGRLRNRAQRDAVIPYRATVDGRVTSLESPLVWTEAAGTRLHRVVIEIGMVERVLAGVYEDALTLTISGR